MDIAMVMSDGTITPLKDMNPTDYHLTVKSLDPSVIAFAPTEGAEHPRVIAVGTGQGKLLRVSLEPASHCQSGIPIALQDVFVMVKFKDGKEAVQQKGKNLGFGASKKDDKKQNMVDKKKNVINMGAV